MPNFFRKACTADLPRIREILSSARAYMRRSGNMTQWTGGYPSDEVILEDIRQGQSYVLEREGRIYATFCLMTSPEPTYAEPIEGSWPETQAYATIHRAASDGSENGILEQIVTAAELLYPTLALRADTHVDNQPTQRALVRCGFRPYTVITLADGTLRTGYQRTEAGIRPLRAADIDAVMQIWLAANTAAHSFIPADYWRSNFDCVRRALPDSEVYVHHNNGRVEGFIGLDGCHVEGLFVDERYRRRGIGLSLVRYALSTRPELRLEVYARNTAALGFYRTAGFLADGESICPQTGEMEYQLIMKP